MNFKKLVIIGTSIIIMIANSSTAIFAAEQGILRKYNEDINIKVATGQAQDIKETNSDINIAEKIEGITEESVNDESANDESVNDKEESITLSLEEAVEYALKNNKDILIQNIELQKAELMYTQNIRDVKEKERNIDDIPAWDQMTGMVILDSVSRELIENGVHRRSVELAYQISKWNKDIKLNQIKYDVEKIYFDLFQIEKELEIAKENLNLCQKQYNNAKLKHDIGIISNQELLGFEMGLSQARTAYDSAKIYYELQLMNFQNTLGLPFNKEVVLTDTIEYREYEPINLEKSIEEALENNTMVKVTQENYELSELTLEAVKVKYPEITYKYKEQEAEVAKAAKNLETVKNGVEMSVRAAYLNLLTAEKQIKTLEKNIEQAENMVHLAEVSFELGQGTSTETLQANLNLMNAKKELSNQIHAFNMALLDYEYSIGIGKTLIAGV